MVTRTMLLLCLLLSLLSGVHSYVAGRLFARPAALISANTKCSSYWLRNRLDVLTSTARKASNIVEAERNNSVSNSSNVATITTTMDAEEKVDNRKRTKVIKFIHTNWLILGEILVIFLAQKYPKFGATGGPIKPEFWISKIGVFTIFFINGIALSISGSPDELQSAYKTNLTIQLYNFLFIPLFALLFAPLYPDKAFRDGLLVLSCLPCTINICVAQTLAANGNMATAIFNAIFANVIGVFLTPLLSIWLLGAGKGTLNFINDATHSLPHMLHHDIGVSLLSTLHKLGYVVIFPLAMGQLCRMTPVGKIAQKISGYSRTLSSCLLLAIVYNVFSDTFNQGIGVSGGALGRLIMTMPMVYMLLSGMFWTLSKKLLPGLDYPTRSAALFCSSQKTLAFGIPFIKTALGSRSDIAYILAPLLMYAPAQLFLGSSILVPAMLKLNKRGQEFAQGGGI